jgi:hypothetical protein
MSHVTPCFPTARDVDKDAKLTAKRFIAKIAFDFCEARSQFDFRTARTARTGTEKA